MSSQQQFRPIEPNADHWPITKFHKDQKAFLTEVVDRSFTSLSARYPVEEAIFRILAQTTTRELVRIASNPWACDPKDDRSFWEAMQCSIEDKKIEATKLLKKIIERYVEEMRSNFSVRHYQLIAKSVHHTFINLLKPHCFGFGPREKRWASRGKRLQEKFHVTGEVDTLRALAEQGTIVLAPTHTSNWDSVVIGLAMKQLGLSPLSWGMGLNLFNNRGFRYIFNKMGTYKIDRRKKTIPYLQTQKDYVALMLEWGCHTLFYPSGTRSRSGSIASDLKLGLLGAPFEAQVHNFQKHGANAKKFFIVPLVLNYHSVLEAYPLIREWVQEEEAMASITKQNCCYTNLLLSKNILLKGSEIFINIGAPLDVMGNRVDLEGGSYDAQGKAIDLYSYFLNLPLKTTTRKRSNHYVQALSHKIVESYYRINSVLSSHLVAFVAYELAKKIEGFSMKLPSLVLKYRDFMTALSTTYKALHLLYAEKKIDFTPILLNGPLDAIAKDGLAKLGIYHATAPLVVTPSGDLLIQDLLTLLYYHNRLIGYGLEATFTP